jgi:hypothetical protein
MAVVAEATGMVVLHIISSAALRKRRWDDEDAIVGRLPTFGGGGLRDELARTLVVYI